VQNAGTLDQTTSTVQRPISNVARGISIYDKFCEYIWKFSRILPYILYCLTQNTVS